MQKKNKKETKWYSINTIGILGEDNGWSSPTICERELVLKRSEIHKSYPWSLEDQKSMKIKKPLKKKMLMKNQEEVYNQEEVTVKGS